MPETPSRLDFALDLQLREMELYAANFQSLRNSVTTAITIGATIDSVLAAGALTRTPAPSGGKVLVASLMFVALLILASGVLWISKDTLGWPDGFTAGRSAEGSLADYKRALIAEMNQELTKVKKSFGRVQFWLIPLMVSLVLSIGAWVWILKTTTN